MTTKPGQVFLVDLGYDAKLRPMVIVSREDDDAPRALSLCAPATTQFRDSPYEVYIGKPRFLLKESYVNVQGIQAIQHHELGKYLGILSDDQIEEIKQAIRFACDL
ncbi:MAG: type II toxin-antitoxin system PemK/MazF family toxin [Lentisphaeraceae bacterium]|nr:type II toxin-antitoxin system PemK/MazF family toxin [Lentisphaeraceae bacterium]